MDEKIFMFNKKFFTIVASTLVISACSPSPVTQEQSLESNKNLSGLFGYLEKNADGQYYFSKFTFHIPNIPIEARTDPWVYLETMEPRFNTNEEQCSTTKDKLLCNTDDSLLFRTMHITSGDVLTNTLGNSFIGFIKVASIGQSDIEMRGFYTTAFDQDEYKEAIEQAKNTTDIKKLKHDYEDYNVWVKKRESEYTNKVLEQHKYLTNHINFKVIDNSKLFNRTVSNSSVSIVKPRIYRSLSAGGNHPSFDSMKKRINTDIDNMLSTTIFKVKCDLSQLEGYQYSTTGCEKTFDMKSNNNSIPVSYTIEKRKNFEIDYFPSIEDNMVGLMSDGSKIKIKNKTKSYLNIKTLSMYVNDDIETNTNINMDIPPQSVVEIAKKTDFPNTQKNLTLNNVTESDIKRKIKVGAALKYVVVDTNKEKTLFNVNDISPYQHH